MQSLFHAGFELIHVTRNCLQGKNNEDGEPVEHVMYGGCPERPPELVFERSLAQRHDGVCDRGADVSAHHDVHSILCGDYCR